jgi:hypothetical protein
VGHRALHAVPTAAGRYDCYRTRWDGLAVFEHPDRVPDPRDSHTPVAEGVDATGVLALLEPTDEALFVHGERMAYLVCRLDVPAGRVATANTAVPMALVAVTDGAAADRLDAELQAVKAVLGDAVDAGLVPRAVAEGYLRIFLARHPDAREVIWHPLQ